MYAIAINGSPRKGGNTEALLERVLGPLQAAGWETETVKIGGTPMRGCIACYSCFERQDNTCILKDDVFNDLFSKVVRADAVIIGSPTYFSDVSAETKGFLDRTGLVSIANGNVLAGKVGAAVIAVRRGGATHAFDSINHMFLMSRMIVPGSTYWNMGYGREKEEVLGDTEGLANMDHLGRMINWVATALAPAMQSMPTSTPRPE